MLASLNWPASVTNQFCWGTSSRHSQTLTGEPLYCSVHYQCLLKERMLTESSVEAEVGTLLLQLERGLLANGEVPLSVDKTAAVRRTVVSAAMYCSSRDGLSTHEEVASVDSEEAGGRSLRTGPLDASGGGAGRGERERNDGSEHSCYD